MDKNGEDFRQLAFQSITHRCIRGRQYKFSDNIWLAYFTDEFNSLDKTLAVRRCNNFLRWVNKDNGKIEAVPCVVDYDMSSPAVQVTQSIITPNNHATIMVQGNDLTNAQLKTNMRFMLAGRPFKLTGFQNTIMDDLSTPDATLLYLDLYLDEIQANDDIANNLAFNGHYNYTITPSQLSINNIPNSMGNLTANVLLNGGSVIRPLTWSSSNLKVIQIDDNGNYTITGSVGDTATITVGIQGNAVDVITIPVSIVESVVDSFDIYINPMVERIREYESISFAVESIKSGVAYINFTSVVSLNQSEEVFSSNYLAVINNGSNNYTLNCKAFTSSPQILYITVTDVDTGNIYTRQIPVKTVNMFG